MSIPSRSEAYAALPAPRQRTQEQLARALWSLRADRLFTVSLAGKVEDVEGVFADANRQLPAQGANVKALGEPNADLVYTPLNLC